MRAPKRYKTIKKERYFAIAKPIQGDVYHYLTYQATFEQLGSETIKFNEPIQASSFAENNVELGYYEIHLFENFVKKLLI